MKILLDTHVLLWALGAPERMPSAVLQEIDDPANDVLFSAASIWEIAIKAAQGRANFTNDPVLIANEALAVGFQELPVHTRHTFALKSMPMHHRDPFDRLLLAQALSEPAWLYTADQQLAAYTGPVRKFAPN